MKKIKNRKALLAIVALLLITIVGTTLAYFYSSGTFTNVFQAGTYRLVTTEVFQSPDNWKPGDEVSKIITTKNEGTVPAVIRMSYTEEWFDSNDNDITSEVDRDSAIINFDNTDDWIYEDGYYYYKYILEPNQETSSFIKSVTLNDNIGEMECTMENLTEVCEAASPAIGSKYILTITKETIQYNAYQEAWSTNVEIIEKPNVVTILSGEKGNLQPGDVVGIGETEDFYVLSSDNSDNGKTVLLAKYNLLVGYIINGSNSPEPIPINTPGYGLQNVDSVGYSDDWNGGVYFSDTAYWMDGNNLKDKYNENNSIYYDSSSYIFKYSSTGEEAHPYVYDENSKLYTYINGENGYVSRLIEMGAPNNITGRLLTYEEADNNKNVKVDDKSIILGIHNSLIGTARGISSVDGVTNDDCFYDVPYDYVYYLGLRPVIEIYTKDIS